MPCFHCLVESVTVLRHTRTLTWVSYNCPMYSMDRPSGSMNIIPLLSVIASAGGWYLFTPSHQTGSLSRLGSCLHLASPTSITAGPWSVCSIAVGTLVRSLIVMISNSFSQCIVLIVAPVIGLGTLMSARSGCDLSPHAFSPLAYRQPCFIEVFRCTSFPARVLL